MSDEKLNKNSQKALNRNQAYEKVPEKTRVYFECIAHNTELLYEALAKEKTYEDDNSLNEDYIKYIFEAAKFVNIGFYLEEDIEEVKKVPLKHVELGAELFYRDILGRDDLKNLTPDEKIIRRLGRDMTLYHHERWDGRGYPEGLFKEEIPIAARIVSICCEFLRLTTYKTMGSPLTREEAVNKIASEASKNYDPLIIEAFTRISKDFALYGEKYLSYNERKAKLVKTKEADFTKKPIIEEKPKVIEEIKNEPSPPPIKVEKKKTIRIPAKMGRYLKRERPIYLSYSPVLNNKSKEIDFYRTTLLVNAKYYGAMKPEIYEGIAKRNNLSLSLLEIELAEVKELFLDRKELKLPIKPVTIRLNDTLLEKKAVYNKLIDFLEKNEIEANKIIFEIPENVLILKNQKIKDTIKKLRQAGFKLAIYDFNLDYLTLQRLIKFKFNYLLVSKDYIKNLEINPSVIGIAKSILDVSHAIGVDSICDGVDTKEILNLIKNTGYKFVEGLGVSEKLTIKDLVKA